MSAARSTKISITNNTGMEFVLSASQLDHGEWSDGQSPPGVIEAGSTGVIQAESNGFLTGDQGYLTYSGFTFNFDNPYDGSNSYSEKAPGGYQAIRNGGGGNNADVTWTCSKSSSS